MFPFFLASVKGVTIVTISFTTGAFEPTAIHIPNVSNNWDEDHILLGRIQIL